MPKNKREKKRVPGIRNTIIEQESCRWVPVVRCGKDLYTDEFSAWNKKSEGLPDSESGEKEDAKMTGL